MPTTRTRQQPLTVERIVDTACRIVERDGLGGLSMRKLGTELGVDAMAVYHHVANKSELLALVVERVIATMPAPDPAAAWDVRVRQWAVGYWEVVAGHRDLALAGLGDLRIARAGRPSTEALVAAVADSGIAEDLVQPSAFLIVDAVHGSALAAGAVHRDDADGRAALRAAFDNGITTILAGITARARIGAVDEPT